MNQSLEPLLRQVNANKAKIELARRYFLDFVVYIKHDYIVNWHHSLLCSYLDRFISGEITRLMVFMPPQHGKEISNNEFIITTNGIKRHGNLEQGDYVYHPSGHPIKVLQVISQPEPCDIELTFSNGQIIKCHRNHEWTLIKGRRSKITIETNNLLNTDLVKGSKGKIGSRYIYQLPDSNCIDIPDKDLIIDPYFLGASLGDGGKNGATIHAGDGENEVLQYFYFSDKYNVSFINTHKDNKVVRLAFFNTNLQSGLKKEGLINNKHIPEYYILSSKEQRLRLLAGLIDTGGSLYKKTGQYRFINTNLRLINDVCLLLSTLGYQYSVTSAEPRKEPNKRGIQDRKVYYQIGFTPSDKIPCKLPRKQSDAFPLNRKVSIISIRELSEWEKEPGKCIQVDSADGLYLVGLKMIPTHNSQLVSRSLPAYILGKNPKSKIVVASYSSDLSSSFNRDCQRIITSKDYSKVFPNTRLNEYNRLSSSKGWLRNSEIFEIMDHGGFFKAVGVGGALTGNPADYAIIDDPVKDSLEAMSATFQVRNWNWYNDVLFTRIHNESKILITQTRWNENDLSGLIIKSMQDGRGENWTILSLPSIKENNDNLYDPRQIGEALWPEKHSLDKLKMIQKSSLRTFQSLYQQNPQPVETGGEFYKEFKFWMNVRDFDYNPSVALHISFDFNVNPGMHATIWQIESRKAYQINEITSKSPRNNTIGLCNEFKRLYPNHTGGLFVYGDPSGQNEDTRSEKGFNDYSIILRELSQYKPNKRVAASHPSVKMRGNFINTIFENGYNGLKIYIGSKCVKTIEDLQFIKETPEGTKFKEKAKDLSSGISYEKYGHLSDSMDYFICEAFKQDYFKYQHGESGFKPISGQRHESKNSY